MLDYVSIQKSLASRELFDSILPQVQEFQSATSHIPAIARQDPEGFIKAWKTLSTEKPSRAPKSAFFDPLSLQYALGYKDRRYNLTYETLKRVASQLSIVSAIINTRIAQIASFSAPYRTTKSLGYIIRHKEAERLTTNSERRFIQQLEAFISSCGEPGRENPFTRIKRPKFEHFLKQVVRDTLTYDQLTFEVVPRNNGIPFEFRAVDASTIRIASPDRDTGTAVSHSYHQRNLIPGMTGPTPYRYGNMYVGQQYGREMLPHETVQYVQVINGQIENVYNDNELSFGIRNPRTDIYVQGYGFGELEQLITIITSLLYAEEYNRRFFTQGAHPKGILNFKGDNWTPDQLEAFRRQWVAQIAGAENAWKTPITQSEGLEWVNMQLTNQDMQFNIWIEYLLKVTCGVFLMDPAEINFDLHGGVQQTPLFESSQEWKLKASRDRGLKPLLRFIAGLINEHIIDRIDDHFVFEFIGLDELTEQEKHDMMKEQISTYMTLNEGRRTLDLPDIPGGVGELPLNPVILQLLQFLDGKRQREEEKAMQDQQMAQQQQMMQQQQQQGQVDEQGNPIQPEQTPDELTQTKVAAAQQKMQHADNKHPLELAYLKQKIINGGGQIPPELDQQQQPVEEAPTGEFQQPQYAGLVGKAIDFDTWLDSMRSKL